MKILFLGGNMAKDLADWLKKLKEDVIYKEDIITADDVKQISPEMIVSYNYKYIIPKQILNCVDDKVINLHISYLPFNKGSHPNVWSFLENTPKGVTIHYIDEGIDTGNIIIQKEVYFDESKETLKSSYEKLHMEIQEIFKENWGKIKADSIKAEKQVGKGSIHFKREFTVIEPLIREKGWDTSIRELKEKYRYRRCSTDELYKPNVSRQGIGTEMEK